MYKTGDVFLTSSNTYKFSDANQVTSTFATAVWTDLKGKQSYSNIRDMCFIGNRHFTSFQQ